VILCMRPGLCPRDRGPLGIAGPNFLIFEGRPSIWGGLSFAWWIGKLPRAIDMATSGSTPSITFTFENSHNYRELAMREIQAPFVGCWRIDTPINIGRNACLPPSK
jgi:hypothetical protein